MKNTRFFLAILCLLFVLTKPLIAEDKEYFITEVRIDAELAEDGSMMVNESRTFKFSGKFSYLYRFFPLDGPVQFTDFSVFEGIC